MLIRTRFWLSLLRIQLLSPSEWVWGSCVEGRQSLVMSPRIFLPYATGNPSHFFFRFRFFCLRDALQRRLGFILSSNILYKIWRIWKKHNFASWMLLLFIFIVEQFIFILCRNKYIFPFYYNYYRLVLGWMCWCVDPMAVGRVLYLEYLER